jgi:nucleoside-specific outer membrane channel protein Tsx
MYAYVYHQYVNNFLGNQVSADWFYDQGDYQDLFYERIAYSFIAGDVLTVVIDQDGVMDWNWGKRIKDDSRPDQERISTLVANLNYWRRSEYKKFIHLGKMVKPLATTCGEYEAKRFRGKMFKLPRVHTGAYVAEDGSFGQFFATYFANEEKFTVEIPEDGYELVYQDGKRVPLAKGTVSLTVPALSAVLITKA